MMEPEKCVIQRKGGPCRNDASLSIGWEGSLCEEHADMIWRRVEARDTENCDRYIPGAEGRDYFRADFRKKRSVDKRKPTAQGQIYFVQVDGLIKVGWTSKLVDRIRAYGPKAVLLANYPGTRSDEAALHRQLAPARAHGREWYLDGAVVRMFIDEVLATHGPPRFEAIKWTEPKATVAGKRAARYR